MPHNEDPGGNRRTSPAHGIPTIAVLPFINLSADPEREPLIDAITVDVITGLSCDPRLSTIAYNSVRQFKGNIPDINEFGSLLGVRYVVEGAVRLIGSRLRVSIALIDESAVKMASTSSSKTAKISLAARSILSPHS